MPTFTIPGEELWDDEKNTFLYLKSASYRYEHSLLAIRKWEAKHKKSYLHSEKTVDENLDYIRCMCIGDSPATDILHLIPERIIVEINEYINDPMTATTIRETENTRSKKIITSEIVYAWLVAAQIPFEVQKWHINQVLMLLRVISEEQKNHKPSNKDMQARHKAIRAKNRGKKRR